jgi:hypothetical protein
MRTRRLEPKEDWELYYKLLASQMADPRRRTIYRLAALMGHAWHSEEIIPAPKEWNWPQ